MAREVAVLYGLPAPARPLVFVEPFVAELAKLASNAFLAAKVIFASELREVAGAAWEEVATVLSMDPNIGPSHLAAGGSASVAPTS